MPHCAWDEYPHVQPACSGWSFQGGELKEGAMLKTIALAVGLTTLGFSQTAPPAGPSEQLKQYLEQLKQNPSDDALRGKLIELALSANPKPTTPDVAWEASGKGGFLLENGKSAADFAAGAAAFAQAALAAPWVPDFYFNQGVLWERAERYQEAIKAFRWYLTAAPASDDRSDVLVRIGRLEAMADKRDQESGPKAPDPAPKPEAPQQLAVAPKPEAPPTAAPEAERGHVETDTAESIAELMRSLSGDYEGYACSYETMMKGGVTGFDKGCNDAELKGGHWWKLGNYKLVVQGGQILFTDDQSGFVNYVGMPTGSTVSGIRWERFWPPVSLDSLANRVSGKDAWGRLSPDGNRLLLSNDRPLDDRDYNPRLRYHYWDLRRRGSTPPH